MWLKNAVCGSLFAKSFECLRKDKNPDDDSQRIVIHAGSYWFFVRRRLLEKRRYEDVTNSFNSNQASILCLWVAYCDRAGHSVSPIMFQTRMKTRLKATKPLV